ncbi:MAG: hypothetical protein ABUT20_65430, partial [Bacteroidota bacterium]
MDTLFYIDEYFTGLPSEDEKKEFEMKIQTDPTFAEEVAIYLSAKQLAGQQSSSERSDRFKSVYEEYKKINKTANQPKGVIRRLWPYIAAAAILTGLLIGWVVFSNSPSPEQLADRYIKENFQMLGVTMGNKEDSLEKGRHLFNDGKLNEALIQFENIA